MSEHFNRVAQLPSECQAAYHRLRVASEQTGAPQLERSAYVLVQEIFRLMERDYLASWERNPDRMGS